MAVKITHDLLMRAGACKEHRDLFQETFPDGAEVNEENLQRALAAGLNLHWFVLTFFRNHYGVIVAETEVVTARMNVRRAKLTEAYKEEMGWLRYRVAWQQVRQAEKKELNIVVKDLILRYWEQEYGDEKKKYWFSLDPELLRTLNASLI